MLDQLGINIAIDNFGTGYSSLAYLKQLPIKRIKVDQPFLPDITTNPNDHIITNAVAALES